MTKGKALSRLIREYVGSHAGCQYAAVLDRVAPAVDFTVCYLRAGKELYRLVCEGELIDVNGRLYLSSTRTVASAVCK